MTDKLVDKVNDLEASLGLLQHDYEAQNETILWLTGRVKDLENVVKRLARQLEDLETANNSGGPVDEKPPHW